jgi:ketosteroid isomerase-like protein
MSSGSATSAPSEYYRTGCIGLAIVSLLLVLGIVAWWAMQQLNRSAAHSAAHDVLAAQKTAWNAGDLAGYMATYRMHEQTTLHDEAGRLFRGWDQINERFRTLHGSRVAGELAFEDVVIDVVSTDTVIVRGRWIIKTTTRTIGLFTMMIRRFPAPEGWKIIHDHVTIGVQN